MAKKPVKKQLNHPNLLVGPTNRGPKGAIGYTSDERKALQLDKRLAARYISANLHLTEGELKVKMEDINISFAEKWIIGSMLKNSENKTYSLSDLDYLLNRSIGKVTEEIDLNVRGNDLEGKSLAELQEMKRKLAESNRATISYIEKSPYYERQTKKIGEDGSSSDKA